ncbi:MAG: hypothetical protein AAFP77_28400 [Bacteroidota bacterium]
MIHSWSEVKSIKVTRKTYHRELYFNPQGLLISATTFYQNATEPMHFSTSFTYDESGRLIEKHTAQLGEQGDTLESNIVYYDFEKGCLSTVRARSSKSEGVDTVLTIAANPGYVYLESFENNAFATVENRTNELYFDEKGRRRRLLTNTENDNFTLEWVYEDTSRSVTFLLDGYQQGYEEFNELGQVVYQKYDAYSLRHTYDESGKLISVLHQSKFGSTGESKYRYNSKGLPKATYSKIQDGKSKKIVSYEYEYF